MLRRREFLTAAALPLAAAPVELKTQAWRARWIAPGGAGANDYGVYHFRRSFELAQVPAKFVIHVSGDSRYRLFVNGKTVASGPARGDPHQWRYETVDIASALTPGRNTLAAAVWNDGPHAAVCQWSVRTAFLLQADDQQHEPLVNTGSGWRSWRDAAYTAVPVPTYQLTGYYAIGPCERFDARAHPWGWEQRDFDDSEWKPVSVIGPAAPRDAVDGPNRWMLTPRPIPAMEETPQRFAAVRNASGMAAPSELRGVTIPARTFVRILADQGHLTTAYPELEFSGGRDATIGIAYTEGLFQTMRPRRMKGNRNEVDGKEFVGYADHVIADGGRRVYRPLYWRTFRYVQLSIQTGDTPLTIEDFRSVYTGYPFERRATFDSGNRLHQQILDTGWRTARLCAHETYMDCPYYEQLQYSGDTRIQNLVSVYMTGDARLMRNAIQALDSSRTHEGATLSRAPSVLQQYIPPFSLWWIGMVHDYWRYADDPEFVKQMLTGARPVLGFYSRHLTTGGLLGAMPWWNYVDWVESWPRGAPPCEPGMMPASIQLQFLLALQWAAELENALGYRQLGEMAATQARLLNAKIRSTFWDSGRRIFSEDRAHQKLSQHANALAVLAGVTSGDEARDLMERVEADKSLAKCSVYFRYYLDRAMAAAGLGGRYLDRLGTWEFMLSEGLTTWAEQDTPYTRSDCHAWGASPNIEFFRTVLGIDSAAPGFSKVLIEPNPGKLTRVSGSMPHRLGTITVALDGEKATIDLPPSLTGVLKWKGREHELRPGRNQV